MSPLAENMDDVGVGQAPQQPGFLLQATGLLRMRRELWQEDLACQRTDIRGAPDLMQFRDAAGAQMPDYSEVVPDAGSELKYEARGKTRSPPGDLPCST